MSGTLIQCKTCKNNFNVDDKNIHYIKVNGWKLPTRCPDCQKFRKEFFAERSKLKKISREWSIKDSQSINKLKEVLK